MAEPRKKRNPYVDAVKIQVARALSLLIGKVPDRASWPSVWSGSRRYARNRWKKRDAAFERRDFDYDDAVKFLTGLRRGSAKDIRYGSIPKENLDYIAGHLRDLKQNRPLRGLHIGNFVGLSLAHVTDTARRIHPGSLVLSIDPNLPHRGVDVPHDMVTGLMTRYRLEANWLPVTAFSLARSEVIDIQNEKHSKTAFSSYHGFAATNALQNLNRLGMKFDFVLIDGNHGAAYLSLELDQLKDLVRGGGLLFLDDVDEDSWEGVYQVFRSLDETVFRRMAHEDRVGVVRRIRPDWAKRG